MLRGLLCISLAVGVLAAPRRHHHDEDEDPADCPYNQNGPFARWMSQLASGRIEQLQRTVDELSSQLQRAKKANIGQKMMEMEKRITQLEGSGCADDEFRCGGVAAQCISETRVCDGNRDCPNGADESPSRCRDIFEAGDSFIGTLHLEKCGYQGDWDAILAIHGTRQYDSVSTREWIVASVTTRKHGQLRAFPKRGYFNYAKRQLVLVNPPDDPRGDFTIVCRFDIWNDDHGHCRVMRDKTDCGEMHVDRDNTRGAGFFELKCEEQQFECGGSRTKCIEDSQVCDGVNDCPGGADESPAICRSPLKEGMTFSGRAHFERCIDLPDHDATFYINYTRGNEIKATILSNDADKRLAVSYKEGEYNFAKGELVLRPSEGASDEDRFSMLCRFSDTKQGAHCAILDGSRHCGSVKVSQDDTVFSLRAGDVFNGVHTHDGCLELDDHPATLVIGGILGNGIRATMVTEVDGKIQAWPKKGVFDVKKRQLILESRDREEGWTYICTFSADGDEGNCRATRKRLRETCGGLTLKRDRIAKKINVGDSFAGLVQWDACRDLPDHNATLIVTEKVGNAIKVTVVTQIGSTINDYEAVGYINPSRVQVMLLGADRGRLGVRCTLQEGAAEVGATCNFFSTLDNRQCGTFNLKKRRQAPFIKEGDTFSGRAHFNRCYNLEEHNSGIIITKVIGNGIQATVISRIGGEVRSWEKRGLMDPQTRRMLLVPITKHSGDLSYYCTFRSQDENSMSCQITNEDLSTSCGTFVADRDPTVRLFTKGSTYSGRASFDRCALNGVSSDTKLIITEKKGNGVQAAVVMKTDEGDVKHWHFGGFYYVPNRQLILAPSGEGDYSLVCEFSEFSDARANCAITEADLSKRCGTVEYNRDQTAAFINAGDSFTGTANIYDCKNFGEFEGTFIIKEQYNNIFLAVVVATDGDQVRTWQKKGFIYPEKRKMVVMPVDEHSSEDLSMVCDFTDQDSSTCKVVTNDLSKQCGVYTMKRDPTARFLGVGATFSGSASMTSCGYAGDFRGSLIITEAQGNAFRATVAATDGTQARSWTKKGFFSFSRRKLVLAPDGPNGGLSTLICDFSDANIDATNCMWVKPDFSQKCGTASLKRDRNIGFLNSGDTFSGTLHFDSCLTVPDHPGAIVIKERQGNTIRASIVSRAGERVRGWDLRGVFDWTGLKLVLVPEGYNSQDLSLLCSFTQGNINRADCQILTDDLTTACGTFTINRDALVRLMSPGDTFSGLSHFDDCVTQADSEASILVTAAEGNAFSGRLVTRLGEKVRSSAVQGFIYVPGRQLIISRPGADRNSLGLVCTMSTDNDNAINCRIMTDGLSKSCGTLGLRRDHRIQFLNAGDSFTGTVHLEKCSDVHDHPGAIVITRREGNAVEATLISKIGTQVRSWNTKGFFYVAKRTLILVSEDYAARDIALACKFETSDNSASCKVLSDNMSRDCGTFDITRDFSVDILAPGDSFSGSVKFTDCYSYDDHKVAIVVSEAQGNAFKGYAISRLGGRIRKFAVGGFFYIPNRQLIITPTDRDSSSMGFVCQYNKDSDNDADCQILTDNLSKTCGSVGLERDRRIRFLNTGDSFTGTVHFDSCVNTEDHPVAMVISESAGNLVKLQIASKIGNVVKSWPAVGFFHVGSRKLFVTHEDYSGRNLEMVCTFSERDDGAECTLTTDGFSKTCGSVPLTRDHIVNLVNAGDTFSGTANFESCVDVTNAETALVISEAQGNAFRGTVISRVNQRIVYKKVRGLFYVPGRQLIVVPDEYSGASLSMVCTYKADSDNDADCQILTDSFTTNCGTLSLERDRTIRFLNAGDTFSGTVHFDTCSKLDDHPGSIVITASAGNAVKATFISKYEGQVRSWEMTGFFYYPGRQLLMARAGFGSRDLSLVCRFQGSDNAAQCQILRDNFATACGSFNMERDFTADLVTTGDSFSGTAEVTSCFEAAEYPVSLVIGEAQGNAFKGTLVSKIKDQVLSRPVKGYLYIKQRQVVIVPESYSSTSLSMVCTYNPDSDNDADCQLLTDNFSRKCGTVALSRDHKIRFLNAGDTFTGNVHFDSCSKVADHKGAIIITQSEGNAVRASIVSNAGGQVREYSARGFFYVSGRKLILEAVDADSRSAGLVCSFSVTDDKANCTIMRDHFTRTCGTFNVNRDITIDTLNAGDTFSGTASYSSCFTVDDHPVTIIISKAQGNAFKGTVVTMVRSQVRSRAVRGFYYSPNRQIVVVPDEYNWDSLSMVCAYTKGSDNHVDCTILTDYMNRECGSVGLNRDRRVRNINAGDTFSGTVQFDPACSKVADHKAMIVIRESSGNAFKATFVSKPGDKVFGFKAKGFVHVGNRKIIIVPEKVGARTLGLVCSVENQNEAKCDVLRDNFSQKCGTFNIQRDYTADIVAAGDTFSGSAAYTSCFDVTDLPTTIIVSEAQGNGFRGSIVTKVGDQVLSRAVSGFLYIPQRQLIVVPEDSNSNSLSLLCSYDKDSDNDAECKILTDQMSRECGTLSINRDRRIRFLNEGDTFTGTVQIDSCAKVEDHPAAIVITKSAGNAIMATLVSKVKGQVRSYKAKGFFYVAGRQLILEPVEADATSLGLVCVFRTSDNSAECKLVKDHFSKACGSITIQRDYTVDILHPGDTFTGTASFDSCLDVDDHQTALVISEAQGNGFRGIIVSKIGEQVRSRRVSGFFYIPNRQLIISPDSQSTTSLSLVCSYQADSDNDADCKILTDYMTRSCGSVGLSRDRKIGFLKAGDTFSGTLSVSDCVDGEDQPAAIVIRESEGNALKASVVTKMGGYVVEFSVKGFYYVPNNKLLLVPKGKDSRSFGLVCTFVAGSDDSATCEVMRDNFSKKCGTFDMNRDHIVDVIKPGDTFSGMASYDSCFEVDDHRTTLVISESTGNAFRGTLVAQIGETVRSRKVRGFQYIPNKQVIVVPDEYSSYALSMVCEYVKGDKYEVQCKVLTDYMTKQCGDVKLSRDRTTAAFQPGDTFSGTVHFDECSKLPDHPAAIVISESAGNVLKARYVSKVQDHVFSSELSGFLHTETRKLILVPDKQDSKTLAAVCDFNKDENSASCTLLRDNFSQRCGSIDIKRDFIFSVLHAGDTLSGTASYSSCLDVEDHVTGLVITESQGNGFRGSMVAHVKGQVRSREVRGFFYIPERKLVVVPDRYDSNSLSLVCELRPDSDSDAECKILTDYMSRECGTLGLSRDRAVNFLKKGDTFSGTFHFDSCAQVEDHPGVIVITESGGNAMRATVVSKVRGVVKSYEAVGIFHPTSKKWLVTAKDVDSKSLGLVCEFVTDENKAECKVMRDHFSTLCGTFNIERDVSPVILKAGDSFSGNAAITDCFDVQDHPSALVITEAEGNAFRGTIIGKFGSTVRSKPVSGFIYVPERQIIVVGDNRDIRALSLVCSYNPETTNDADCAILTDYMTKTCGSVAYSRDRIVRAVQAGDSFSGTVEIEDCADLPDHQASLIITQTAGNALKATMVSKVTDKVREFAVKGFFYLPGKKVIFVPERVTSTSLGLACSFDVNTNTANCEVMKDNFSKRCGSFVAQRDFTVDLYNSGDTFSGTSNFDDCFDARNVKTTLVIGESSGNAFRGTIVSKIGDSIRSKPVRGFSYVPKRQLIVVPDEVSSYSLGLVCTRVPGKEHDAECKVLTDFMTKQCGVLTLSRDRTLPVLNEGDTFSGTVQLSEQCSKAPDHPGAIIIKQSEGNAVKAALISKVREYVTVFDLKGFIHAETRNLILVPEEYGSRSWGLVCNFGSNENSANCVLMRDNLSEKCGTMAIKRDFTVDLLKPGDTFSGTASFSDCFEVDDHPTGLLIHESQGNAFRGSIVSKIKGTLRSRQVRGFFYVPNRQLIIVSEKYNTRALSMVCRYDVQTKNSVDCQIVTDLMTKECGTVGLTKERTIKFINPGDTFTGTVSFDSCTDVEDHPAAFIVTASAGNVAEVTIVSKVRERVRSVKGRGFFHVGSRKWILVQEDHDSRSLSFSCEFQTDENSATCTIHRDNFATECGSIQIQRDYVANVLKAGDTFSGTASYQSCFTVDDHSTSLIITEAQGNAFKGTIAAKLGNQLRSRKVTGFIYVPNRQLIVVPEERDPTSISLLCTHNADDVSDATCQILSDNMSEKCGSVSFYRDRTIGFLNPGDTFSGTVSLTCVDVADHMATIVIQESEGNAVAGSIVSKVGDHVLGFKFNGFFHFNSKKLILVPERRQARSLGFVCSFDDGNSAKCDVYRDHFSKECGSYVMKRDMTVDLVAPGDTFSGTANVRKCFDIEDHPVTVVVSKSMGNLFYGKLVSRIDNNIRSVDIAGLIHIPTRKIIMAPRLDGTYTARTLSMVCVYDPDSQNDADCAIMTDLTSTECGSVSLQRDNNIRFLSTGDSFTGTVHFDRCAEVPDHPAAIIITESAGNVITATIASKPRQHVLRYTTKGFFHVNSKQLILVSEQHDSTSLSMLCSFQGNDNEANCQLVRDNFSTRCGSFNIKRDITVDDLSPGDTFSGTASYEKCINAEDHNVTVVIGEVAGNAFRGAAIFRVNNQIRKKPVGGFFYVPNRVLFIAPEEDRPDRNSFGMVCAHNKGSGNDVDCKIMMEYMTEECGTVGLKRDPVISFLNTGDTFTGTVSMESCTRQPVEDHPATIVISSSMGNIIKGSFISKLRDQVRKYAIHGLFHYSSRKLIMAPVKAHSQSLGLICEFKDDNSAKCELMKDNYVTKCGSFNFKRDFTVDLISQGDVFSGNAVMNGNCFATNDYQVSLVVAEAAGNAFRGQFVAKLNNSIFSKPVGGFVYTEGRKIVVGPEVQNANSLSMVCEHQADSDNDADCEIRTRFMTETCGTVSFNRDKRVRFLNVGDTFSGTISFDSCSRIEDHPGALIITASNGNVVMATIVSRVKDQTRAWDLKGFVHTGSRKLFLAVDGHDSKAFSLVCELETQGSSTCTIVRDNFSTKCGTFQVTRDIRVDLLNAGDTFSGTASFDSCYDVADHDSTIVISEAQGNVFRGSIVSKIRDQVRSRAIRGFFYVPKRQLVIVPDRYESGSLSMVCTYQKDSDNDADCQILTDYMSRSCGKLGVSRDRSVQLFHVGDSFSGEVQLDDSCSDLPDHKAVILITESAGNAIKATVVSKIGDRVRSVKAKGFIAINHRKLILAPEDATSRSYGIVCEFDEDNEASCKLVRDNFSTMCGTFNVKRDFRVSLLQPGDSFTGTAQFDDCLTVDDHPSALIITAVEGNIFSGAVVSKINDKVRSRKIKGFFYVPERKLVMVPDGSGYASLSMVCTHKETQLQAGSCKIYGDDFTRECGAITYKREKIVQFINEGDTFSGTFKYESCADLEDHPGAIVIKRSEGNVILVTVVTRANERIRTWEAVGYFYTTGRKVLLTPENADATSVGLICDFSDTDEGAKCKIMKDSFSTECGTFDMERDTTVDFLNEGDTFSGTASFSDCLQVEDHPTSLVITAAQGNAFRAKVVSRVKGYIKSRNVRGFFHIPSRKLIMVPEQYDSNTLGIVCEFKADSDNDANCQIMTDYMTKTCGTVAYNRDINVRLLNEGDTYSGNMHFESCVDVPDHLSALVITASSGNAIKATLVSKLGDQVRSWEAKGFIHVGSRKLFLTRAEDDSRALNLVCTFSTTGDDSIECELTRDDFSRHCGSFTAQKDFTVDIIRPGDTFTGRAHYDSCLDVPDHDTAVVISEAKGNVFRGSIITKMANKLLSSQVKGFFYIPKRQLILVPEDYSPASLSVVCQYGDDNDDEANCKILTDNFEKECGRIGFQRTGISHHLNVGDTFSGTVQLNPDCVTLEPYEGALIITASEGNAVRATMVAKVNGVVMHWSSRGFFYYPDRKLVLVREDKYARDLSIVCHFENDDHKASCRILGDNYSRECGTWPITRNYAGYFFQTGTTYSGTVKFESCFQVKDHPTTLVFSEAEGNAFKGRMVSNIAGQVRGWSVKGFFYPPNKQLIVIPEHATAASLGLVCELTEGKAGEELDCKIGTDRLTRECGTVKLRKDELVSTLAVGDSYSGTVTFDSCLEVGDHAAAVVFTKVEGNVVKGYWLSKIGERTLGWKAVGFAHIPTKNLILVGENYDERSLSLVCSEIEGDSSKCVLYRDNFSRRCGTFTATKDDAVTAVAAGDTLSGTISFSDCVNVPDHKVALVLAQGQGNVFAGRFVSKPGDQIRSWRVGAYYSNTGKLLVVPEGYSRAGLALGCEFTDDTTANCAAFTDSFSKQCGAVTLKKDERVDFLKVGDTFTGTIHYDSCVDVADHKGAVVITGVSGNAISASVIAKVGDRVKAWAAVGYYYSPMDKLILSGTRKNSRGGNIVCTFSNDGNTAQCQILRDNFSRECGSVTLARTTTVDYLAAGDAFSGSLSFDPSCRSYGDITGGFVVKEISGNAMKASFILKLPNNQVIALPVKAVYYAEQRSLLMVRESYWGGDLTLVCQWAEGNIDSPNCRIASDDFSRDCGGGSLNREKPLEFISPGDTFEGAVAITDCINVDGDRQITINVDEVKGSVFTANVNVDRPQGPLNFPVVGIYQESTQRVIMATENYQYKALSLGCDLSEGSAECVLATEYFTRTCGTVSLKRKTAGFF